MRLSEILERTDVFDDQHSDTSSCPNYPIIRYPCCDFNMKIDSFATIFLFVGAIVPLMFIFLAPVKKMNAERFQDKGENCKGVCMSRRT